LTQINAAERWLLIVWQQRTWILSPFVSGQSTGLQSTIQVVGGFCTHQSPTRLVRGNHSLMARRHPKPRVIWINASNCALCKSLA
jgi:hypothetical protein